MSEFLPPIGREALDGDQQITPPSDSQRLLRALRGAVPVEDAQRVAARRDKLIAVIGREIAQTPGRIVKQERKQRWLRFAMAVAAATVFTLGSVWTWQHATHSSKVARAGEDSFPERDVPEGKALVTLRSGANTQDQWMVTGQQLALHGEEVLSAKLPGETQIEFKVSGAEGSAQLELNRLGQADQSLFVKSGELSVNVPENTMLGGTVPAGTRERRHVMVVTPNAKVEVKGTKFTVKVLDTGKEAQTEVTVQRGRVLVSWLGGQTMLTTGEQWKSHHSARSAGADSSGAGSTVATSDQQAADPRVVQNSARQGSVELNRSVELNQQRTNSVTPPQDAALARTSTLGEQNLLMEQALVAQKRGNLKEAIELYDDLLRQYPDSPLRSTALSEKRRLVSVVHN